MSELEKCPICDFKIDKNNDISNGYYVFHCDNCGEVEFTSAVHAIPDFNDKRYILAGYLFNRKEKDKLLIVDSTSFDKLIDSANIPLTPLDKIDQILLYIYKNTKYASDTLCIPLEKYPICYSYNTNEFNFLIQKARELEYIDSRIAYKYYLNLRGWERIKEIQKFVPISNRAFIAMWFTDEMRDVYKNAFAPALNETGYDPIKVEDVPHNEKIDDRIFAEIRKSGLVIADFTGHRNGVYFEAGFALGLKIPVIWTCRKDDFKGGKCFDTRQYNHIVWEDSDDLKAQLIERIEGSGLSKLINNY